MKARYLWLLIFVSLPAFGQIVAHVTQPFKFFWDEATANVTGVAGQIQVQHFELQVDSGIPLVVFPTGGVPSTTAGFTMFTQVADPLIPVGSHTFTIKTCGSASGVVGCVTSVSFPFVLDPLAPPTALRLGVGQ